MRPHQKLIVWQEGIVLVKNIYTITMQFPDSEKFGLISQLRRAATSIPTNIAEGAARNTKKEFIQFAFFAAGSLSEVETLLIISKEIGFIKESEFNLFVTQINKLSALLNGLIKSLRDSPQ